MKNILAMLSLLTAGCGTCEEVNLTPDERAWFAPYPDGTKVTFRSNRGTTNTMLMQKRQEWHENTNCNMLEAGAFQPIFVQVVLQPATEYDPQNKGFTFSIHKTRPNQPGDLKFSAAGLDYPRPAGLGVRPNELTSEPCTLSTSGKSYPAVYVFREGQNAKNFGNGHLRAIYWDKHDGLIRYDLADGEVFELVGK
ncbi:hypothetical protein [Hymenobacter ruber]